MSNKHRLRKQRYKTVINATSKGQEKDIIQALRLVEGRLKVSYGFSFSHTWDWKLSDVIARLKRHFTDVDFFYHFESSAMRPDGGILSLLDKNGEIYPILVSEAKNQGTNDLRRQEGLKKQPPGNAVERLGKNVIGLRTAFRNETIFPFVCFGYGCDFAKGSSILDRVVTMNMFGHLCKTNLFACGPNGFFDRGSFYFREQKWSVLEMSEIMFDIADRSILYYLSKYGKDLFNSGHGDEPLLVQKNTKARK